MHVRLCVSKTKINIRKDSTLYSESNEKKISHPLTVALGLAEHFTVSVCSSISVFSSMSALLLENL